MISIVYLFNRDAVGTINGAFRFRQCWGEDVAKLGWFLHRSGECGHKRRQTSLLLLSPTTYRRKRWGLQQSSRGDSAELRVGRLGATAAVRDHDQQMVVGQR